MLNWVHRAISHLNFPYLASLSPKMYLFFAADGSWNSFSGQIAMDDPGDIIILPTISSYTNTLV